MKGLKWTQKNVTTHHLNAFRSGPHAFDINDARYCLNIFQKLRNVSTQHYSFDTLTFVFGNIVVHIVSGSVNLLINGHAFTLSSLN